MSEDTNDLLRALISISGRAAISPEDLKQTVTAGRAATKAVRAYNLCNGQNTLTEIAKQSRLDHGNFSRMVSRWEKHGVVFRIGDKLLHLYPLAGE
jgi:hypothetical protein